MDLENGEMILETAQQESSDRNLPLMLDPTVLESRGLDPKLSQVGNLIQVKVVLLTPFSIKYLVFFLLLRIKMMI